MVVASCWTAAFDCHRPFVYSCDSWMLTARSAVAKKPFQWRATWSRDVLLVFDFILVCAVPTDQQFEMRQTSTGMNIVQSGGSRLIARDSAGTCLICSDVKNLWSVRVRPGYRRMQREVRRACVIWRAAVGQTGWTIGGGDGCYGRRVRWCYWLIDGCTSCCHGSSTSSASTRSLPRPTALRFPTRLVLARWLRTGQWLEWDRASLGGGSVPPPLCSLAQKMRLFRINARGIYSYNRRHGVVLLDL